MNTKSLPGISTPLTAEDARKALKEYLQSLTDFPATPKREDYFLARMEAEKITSRALSPQLFDEALNEALNLHFTSYWQDVDRYLDEKPRHMDYADFADMVCDRLEADLDYTVRQLITK